MSPLPLWLGGLALVALMLMFASATIVAEELDMPMAASYLLVLHHGFSNVWHTVSLLTRLPFASLESIGVSPRAVFFGALAICIVARLSQAFIKILEIVAKIVDSFFQARADSKRDKIIARLQQDLARSGSKADKTIARLEQKLARSDSKCDETIARLRQEFAENVEQLAKCANSDEIAALQRVHESRLKQLNKELENNDDEKKSLRKELDSTKSAVAEARLKSDKLERQLQLKEEEESPKVLSLRKQMGEDREARRQAKNALATLEDAMGQLKQEFYEARDRFDCERKSFTKHSRRQLEDLEESQKAALGDKERQLEQQAAQIDQLAAKIRELEMESESMVQSKQELIERQADEIHHLEGQVSERDNMLSKVNSQLVLINTPFFEIVKATIIAMIQSGEEIQEVAATVFMAGLRLHGTDLVQLGVDLQLFENMLETVRQKKEQDAQLQQNAVALLERNQERSLQVFDPSVGTGVQNPQHAMSSNSFADPIDFEADQPMIDETMYPSQQPDQGIEPAFSAQQPEVGNPQGLLTPGPSPDNKSGGFLRDLLNPVPSQGPATANISFTQQLMNYADGKHSGAANPQGAANSVVPSTMNAATGYLQRVSKAVPPPANSARVQGFSMLNTTPATGGPVQRSSKAIPPPANSSSVLGFSMTPGVANFARASNAVPPPANSGGVQSFTTNAAPDFSALLNMPPGMGPSSGKAASSSKSTKDSRYSRGDKSLDY
jgi:hypothetical protein